MPIKICFVMVTIFTKLFLLPFGLTFVLIFVILNMVKYLALAVEA